MLGRSQTLHNDMLINGSHAANYVTNSYYIYGTNEPTPMTAQYNIHLQLYPIRDEGGTEFYPYPEIMTMKFDDTLYKSQVVYNSIIDDVIGEISIDVSFEECTLASSAIDTVIEADYVADIETINEMNSYKLID